jgi:hypothetical protein
MAANSTTYASAFHDVTSGNNYCTAGTTYGYCSSSGATEGFAAGTGYDEVTGLGSVDLNKLATAWTASTSPVLIDTATAVTASSMAPAANANDNFTITVTSDTGTTIPGGTIQITVDGGTAINENLESNGTYLYTTSFATAGSHIVFVAYSGDTTHAASTGSITVNVPTTSSGGGTFSFTPVPTNVTVARGNSAPSTITVTPASGYTGTVDLSFDTSNDTALQNLCYEFTNQLSNGDGSVTVSSATTAVTTQLLFDTNAADCVSAAAVEKSGKRPLHILHPVNSARNNGSNSAPLTVAFAGLLLAGFLGRYSRKFRSLACVIALLAVGFAVSACGGGSSSSTPSNPPKGTYTITLTGQDSATATINASTKFTLTID